MGDIVSKGLMKSHFNASKNHQQDMIYRTIEVFCFFCSQKKEKKKSSANNEE